MTLFRVTQQCMIGRTCMSEYLDSSNKFYSSEQSGRGYSLRSALAHNVNGTAAHLLGFSEKSFITCFMPCYNIIFYRCKLI